MTDNQTPVARRPGVPENSPAPTQPFNWLPIVGFLVLTAAIIAAAYYFLM